MNSMIFALLTLTGPTGEPQPLIAFLSEEGVEMCQMQAKEFNRTTWETDKRFVFRCEVRPSI